VPSYREWQQRLDLPEPKFVVPKNRGMNTTLRMTERYSSASARWPSRTQQLQSQFQRQLPQYNVSLLGSNATFVNNPNGTNTTTAPLPSDLVISFPRAFNPMLGHYEFPTEWMKRTASDLASWGEPFAHGVLLRYLFDFSHRVKTDVGLIGEGGNATDTGNGSDSSGTDAGTFTLAIHSRHPVASDNGCSIAEEMACLEPILAGAVKERRNDSGDNDFDGGDNSSQPCNIWVLSDRLCTAKSLALWFSNRTEYNCTVKVAPQPSFASTPAIATVTSAIPQNDVDDDDNFQIGNSTMNNTNDTLGNNEKDWVDSHLKEHGPLAGIGFFRDLAYAAGGRSSGSFSGTGGARHALIGSYDDVGTRSSTRLLLELMEYNRKMEAWQDQLRQNPTTDASTLLASLSPPTAPVKQCMMYRSQFHRDRKIILDAERNDAEETVLVRRDDAGARNAAARRREWRLKQMTELKRLGLSKNEQEDELEDDE